MMGSCGSKDKQDATKKSRKIDEQMKREQSLNLRTIKLLLLGAGESGKSTVLKQMKILHKEGFSRQELELLRPVVYSNTLQCLLAILRAMTYLGIEFRLAERHRDAQIVYNTIHSQRDAEPFGEELFQAMQRLWSDAGLQDCYLRNNEYQIDDSAAYFLDSLPRLVSPNYLPTEQDVLRTRVKTTGITEVLFELKGITFRVIDVGGQRSERKKWIHCFDSVNAIIFISSLSEYDQTLREDNVTLFLNKTDLFSEKIKRTPLTNAFPEYTGQNNYSECVNYIQWKFEQLNRSDAREIYCHHTCATDTTNVQFVLDACLDMIIAKNLRSMGLV